jgi:hypothetical protein
MFLDFGLRIKARSKALQTFVVQLACTCTWGEYLPTAKAVAGGGYGAEVVSNLVGPEGGQMLVEQTVKLINEGELHKNQRRRPRPSKGRGLLRSSPFSHNFSLDISV